MEYKYEIQHRIETFAKISMAHSCESSFFSFDEICFSAWGGDFSFLTTAEQNFWLAKGTVEASSLKDAMAIFDDILLKLVPMISFSSQCYTEYRSQPFLVKREDRAFAYFRYVRDSECVGLIFGEEEGKALETLAGNFNIPREFYRYWNDAVNSVGYSSKLLLFCAALDALAKGELSNDDKKYKEKFYQKIEDILGTDLKKDLWGTKKDPNSGLRQRLVHGEYLSRCDVQPDYVELVHNRIIQYFNNSILKENLLSEDIIDPQRHKWGNKEKYENFIKAIENKTLGLENILSELEKSGIGNLNDYEWVDDATQTADY